MSDMYDAEEMMGDYTEADAERRLIDETINGIAQAIASNQSAVNGPCPSNPNAPIHHWKTRVGADTETVYGAVHNGVYEQCAYCHIMRARLDAAEQLLRRIRDEVSVADGDIADAIDAAIKAGEGKVPPP
jgi:hypothetical protein